MSSKFELTIDTNYVKDWGVPQAIRELFSKFCGRRSTESG